MSKVKVTVKDILEYYKWIKVKMTRTRLKEETTSLFLPSFHISFSPVFLPCLDTNKVETMSSITFPSSDSSSFQISVPPVFLPLHLSYFHPFHFFSFIPFPSSSSRPSISLSFFQSLFLPFLFLLHFFHFSFPLTFLPFLLSAF